jgi:hypothetical protein
MDCGITRLIEIKELINDIINDYSNNLQNNFESSAQYSRPDFNHPLGNGFFAKGLWINKRYLPITSGIWKKSTSVKIMPEIPENLLF